MGKIDKDRLRFGGLSLVLSGLVAWKFQPLIHGNTDALNTIVTVFSILAGFLVAVITIVGDGVLLGRASWRRDEQAISGVRKRLTRHKLMFQIYLLVLALVFAIQLHGKSADWMPWCERLMLFLASFAFLASLTLPGQIFQERIKKLESQRGPLPQRLQKALEPETKSSEKE
ncbi:TPA: hypothetical protein QEN11_06835 [Stenotrophomonas maltophilia]|nr:hypothetical protein [Stenotrophomonas maltophilia]